MINLVIVGAGGHGKVALDIAIKMNVWKKIVFLDDDAEIKKVLEYPVVGKIDDAKLYLENYAFFIAVGQNNVRRHFQEKLLTLGCEIATLIHPFSSIANDVKIGVGTLIAAGVVVNSSAIIHKGCIINTSSSIDHDCEIGEYTHISPGSHLAGSVNIGRCSFIGVGSIFRNNVHITDNCIIGAGSLVLKNITSSGTYFGSPIKLNDDKV